MGARSGGGASGGMGSRSSAGGRGTTTVFTGGWSGNSADTSDIQIFGINKETEKALNVKTVVSWGDGKGHEKDLWIPKSTIGKITKDVGKQVEGLTQSMKMTLKKTMAQSLKQQHSWNGYLMSFDNSYNT